MEDTTSEKPAAGRTWTLERLGKRAGRMTLGSRVEAARHPDAVWSVTLGANFAVWQFILNSLASIPVRRRMQRDPNVVFAELLADFDTGRSVTISAFRGKAMVPFRDRGIHGFLRRRMWFVFYGGDAEAWFLTRRANGRIPGMEEAIDLAERYGKHYRRGELVRQAQRIPDDEAAVAPAATSAA